MARPVEVEELLAELRQEAPHSGVISQAESKLVLLANGDDRYEFTEEEAVLLLSSGDTLARLIDALDYPDDMTAELHSLEIDQDVLMALEKVTSAVDEM